MPINAFAKKQVAVSHSTTESEMVSLEEGLRTDALQVLTFWEHAVQLFCEPRKQTALRTHVKLPKAEPEEAEFESGPENKRKEAEDGNPKEEGPRPTTPRTPTGRSESSKIPKRPAKEAKTEIATRLGAGFNQVRPGRRTYPDQPS